MKKGKYNKSKNNRDNNKIKNNTMAKIKTVKLPILKIEKHAVIVKLDGWRKRVYLNLSKQDMKKLKKGRMISIKYKGDIEDVHTVEFLPLNKV